MEDVWIYVVYYDIASQPHWYQTSGRLEDGISEGLESPYFRPLNSSAVCFERVSHWMPLPEPPEAL